MSAMLLTACGENLKDSYWQGKIKRESISIASKIPGRVIERRVHEGEFVQKGDTLLVLDIPEVEAKKIQAEGALLSVKSNYIMAKNGATGEQLRQIDAKVMASREQYEFAKNSLLRLKSMFEDSLISVQKFEETKMKTIAAKAQYEGALAQQEEIVNGVRDEKITMAFGQLKRAEGALMEVKIASAEKYVIAPKNMEISSITVRVGELALAGYTLVSAYESESVYFRFTIPEHALSTFKIEDQLSVAFPFKEKEIESRVQSIRQLPRYADKTTAWPENEIGETTFEIKVYPVNPKDLDGQYNNTTVLLKH